MSARFFSDGDEVSTFALSKETMRKFGRKLRDLPLTSMTDEELGYYIDLFLSDWYEPLSCAERLWMRGVLRDAVVSGRKSELCEKERAALRRLNEAEAAARVSVMKEHQSAERVICVSEEAWRKLCGAAV